VHAGSFVVRVLDCGDHTEYIVRDLRCGEERRFPDRRALEAWLARQCSRPRLR
jgi:hypothetical protein